MSDQSTKYPPLPKHVFEVMAVACAPGYAIGYDFISVHVWSCWRPAYGKAGKLPAVIGEEWTPKAIHIGSHNYMATNLYSSGRHIAKLIHHLVAEAFLGPKPQGAMVLHGVSGRHCNLPSNLYYGDQVRNMADRNRDGTGQLGEKNHRSKVRTDDISMIFKLAQEGMAHTKIGARVGLSQTQVSRIIRGECWSSCHPSAKTTS